MAMKAASALDPQDRMRLYITPFRPAIFDRVIPPSLQPLASNITYHTVQTFPERGFGYLDLPTMEAQKLKKKLHGSTLQGAKVRVESARPEKKRRFSDGDQDGATESLKKRKKDRSGEQDGVIRGHELDSNRHIKRGWTENGKEGTKKRRKGLSHVTIHDEAIAEPEGRKLRFKTKLPATHASIDTIVTGKSTKSSKSRQRRKECTEVTEFAKSRKEKDQSVRTVERSKTPVSYVDGVGWINASGDVVEVEPKSVKRKRKAVGAEVMANGQDEASMRNGDDRETAGQQVRRKLKKCSSPEIRDKKSTSPSRDRTPSAGDNIGGGPLEETEEEQAPKDEVHPLEALFKRPKPSGTEPDKPRPPPIQTAFSFFGEDTSAEPQDITMIPQTPHTRQDLEWRGIRSAAPTPDTAAIGRRYSFISPDEADDEDDDDDDAANDEITELKLLTGLSNDTNGKQGVSNAAQDDEREESKFRKWFYENRGDLNRKWKSRRREAKKTQRKRENARLNRMVP